MKKISIIVGFVLAVIILGSCGTAESWHYQRINDQACIEWNNEYNYSWDPPSGVYCKVPNPPVSIPDGAF